MRTEWASARPYQVAALEAIAARSVPRAIVAIATGGGKGFLSGHLTEALGTQRVLYVVHRDTLVEQLEDHVRRVVGGWVGVEQGARRAAPMDRTVIASVQTLTAGGDKRLTALLERGFDALVTDEAHHALADTYMRIQCAMGLLRAGDRSLVEGKGGKLRHKEPTYVKAEAPPVVHVGLTATPKRGDGLGLHAVYDEIVYRKDLASLIREGWLVPIIPYAIQTETSLDEVRTLGKAGDYMEGELGEAVNNAERHEAIFDGWRKAASGLRTLVFCVTTDHAESLAGHFSERGVEARSVHGKQPKSDQRERMDWFQRTPGAVLTSCQLIGEGVDLPHVECVLMARPTRSTTVYAQAVGRGTRLAAGARDYDASVALGKAHCLVLDVTDSVKTIGRKAVRIGDLFGAPLPTAIVDGQDVLDQVEKQEEDERKAVQARDRKASLERVEIIDSRGLPAHFTLSWVQTGSGFLLPCPDGSIARLSTDTLDRWIVETRTPGAAAWTATEWREAEQEDAVAKAEADFRVRFGAAVVLRDRSAPWRNRAPSQGQVKAALRAGIVFTSKDTAGTISDKLDAHAARSGKAVRRAPRPMGPGPCPKCHGETEERRGKFGPFFGCKKYPECRGIREAAPVGAQA